MKYIIWFSFLFFHMQIFGQSCFSDTHSTNKHDSWESCTTSNNPNTIRGNSHWVRYDLGAIYQLDGTWFWNYNVSNLTERGMKNIVIDYSLDGNKWTEAATYTLAQATGQATYTGEQGPALGMIEARYVLITALDSYGNGDCVGLSEVRFEISGEPSLQHDVLAESSGITLYPNPTAGLFVIDGDLANYDIKILDAAGITLQDLSEASPQVVIDISNLPAGMYFIMIKHKTNHVVRMEKILKQ